MVSLDLFYYLQIVYAIIRDPQKKLLCELNSHINIQDSNSRLAFTEVIYFPYKEI